MILISQNLKKNIINKLDEILNIDDHDWKNLEKDIRLKIIHNLCNTFKSNLKNTNNFLNIPLKNQRPKKIIEMCDFNKKINSNIYEEFIKKLVNLNREFRNNYNSKNKNYCFANLNKINYNNLLNYYNLFIYEFLNKHIDIINYKSFFYSLLNGNDHKIISFDNKSDVKINKINCNNNLLNIEFNNNILIEFELYLTSEKITNNIPAKYKIYLINIF